MNVEKKGIGVWISYGITKFYLKLLVFNYQTPRLGATETHASPGEHFILELYSPVLRHELIAHKIVHLFEYFKLAS